MFSPSLGFNFQHQRRTGKSQYHREFGAPSYRLVVKEVPRHLGDVLMQAAPGDLDGHIEDESLEEMSSAQDGVKMREWSDIATRMDTPGYQEFCWGLPGAIPPLGNFDPLGIASGSSESFVKYFREAELTHGRVGMLAAGGFLVQEAFHPLFPDINGPAIKHIPQLPHWTWLVMSLGIGLCEAARIQTGWANPFQSNVRAWSLKKDYTPGQWFDPLSMRYFLTPDEFRNMQEKELSHARLGMIATAGLLAQEAVTGTPWREQFGELLKR
jgi:hypothetical protein